MVLSQQLKSMQMCMYANIHSINDCEVLQNNSLYLHGQKCILIYVSKCELANFNKRYPLKLETIGYYIEDE